MATHYKKLPKEDVDMQVNMNLKTAFQYEDNMDIRKKYRSIYKYSDFDSAEPIKLEQDALHNGRLCQLWGLFLTVLCYVIFFLTLPISGWFCIKTVHNYERLVIFRLGRLKAAKGPVMFYKEIYMQPGAYIAGEGPGMVLVLPCIDYVNKVDLRMKAFSIPPQKILTSDNAAIEVGADVYYRIHDAILSISRIKDLDMSTRVLSQTLLQTKLAKQTLADIESNKHATSQILLENINEMTKAWGMEVGRVEISQIKVIKGPSESGCQAQNLLNMVTPALFPAGTHAPLLTPQETSCSPGQLLQMTAQHIEQAGCSKSLAPAMHQGPPMLEIDKDSFSSGKAVDLNKSKFSTTLNSPRDVIQAVHSHLSPNLVKEFGTLYKFIISGNGGGTFYLDLKNGTGSADEGEPPGGDPDVTLTMNMEVLRGILKGESSAFSAYMTGDLVIEGDVHAATQLAKLVDYIN